MVSPVSGRRWPRAGARTQKQSAGGAHVSGPPSPYTMMCRIDVVMREVLIDSNAPILFEASFHQYFT